MACSRLAGTPPEIVEKLAAAATRAVASPDLQSKIKNNGGDPIVMGPKEFGDYLQKDINRWSEAIEARWHQAAIENTKMLETVEDEFERDAGRP